MFKDINNVSFPHIIMSFGRVLIYLFKNEIISLF